MRGLNFLLLTYWSVSFLLYPIENGSVFLPEPWSLLHLQSEATDHNLPADDTKDWNIRSYPIQIFWPEQRDDKENFQNRQLILEAGFYEPILTAIGQKIPTSDARILDIGCGEGYYSRKLQEAYPKATFYAFDLSKESVQLAAKSDASWKVNWFVGDLAHLPIQSKSIEVILDIFSPANYAEFERVLKAEGVIIKVVPTSSHLKEIRQLAQDQLTKQSYSNQEILEHFEDHCQILSSETISLTKNLTPEERQALLAMTPLLFHVDQEKIDWTQLTEITIEAKLLVGKIKTQRT